MTYTKTYYNKNGKIWGQIGHTSMSRYLWKINKATETLIGYSRAPRLVKALQLKEGEYAFFSGALGTCLGLTTFLGTKQA